MIVINKIKISIFNETPPLLIYVSKFFCIYFYGVYRVNIGIAQGCNLEYVRYNCNGTNDSFHCGKGWVNLNDYNK